MAKFNLTATVNTSLAGTTLAGEQGFTVGVLNGVGATGPQGLTGAGFTGGSYDSSTGIVTFTSDDGLGFSTGDLRGADGTGTGSGSVTSVGTGGGLTGGPVTSSGTISHADTSTQANITATSNTYVDGLTFDDYGHVTGVTTVAGFDGDYSSLTNTPTLFDGDYNSLTNQPSLFDGDYGSLANVPATFAPSAHALSSHSDVSATSPTDGQVLAWNTTGSTWEPQTASGGGGFPSGTAMLFQQSAAPTGWTKQTTHNNKALRVVSSSFTTGGGGSHSFTTVFGTGKTTANHTLTVQQMPSHTHNVELSASDQGSGLRARSAGSASFAGTDPSGSAGSGEAHSHNLDNFDLQYVDVIVATKD